jgi:Mitochondrial carrier protein
MEDSISSFDIKHAIAGGLAGLLSETLMHPFDTISMRSKVHPNARYGNALGAAHILWAQEGAKAFTAGISATVLLSLPSNAVYFASYEFAKATGLKIAGKNKEGNDSFIYFFAGAFSELTTSLLFVPLENVKARLQLGQNPNQATGGVVAHHTNYQSVRHAFYGIYKERGFRGLTSGWHTGLLQDICFSATQFLCYESMKNYLLNRRRKQNSSAGSPSSSSSLASADLSSSSLSDSHGEDQEATTTGENLFSGFVAGGIAAGLTNPIDVITTRLMIQDRDGKFGQGAIQVLKTTLSESPFALWRGALPRMIQIAPLMAIQFSLYEYFKGLLGKE